MPEIDQLPSQEAVRLLQTRRERLVRERAQVAEQISARRERDRAHLIVNDHTCTLLDAEIGWLDLTIAQVSLPRTTKQKHGHGP